MRKSHTVFALAGLCVGAAVPAAAQLGTPVGTPMDVQTYLAQTGCLGVEYAWGFYWISARTLVAGSPHQIGKFGPDGTGLAIFNQAPVYNAAVGSATESPWGGRDGAADETGNVLYFGHEAASLTSYPFNPGTGTLGAGTTIAITGIPTARIIRALARRPSDGHFFTADFGNPIYEFVLTPTPMVVNTFPNNANNGASYAYYGMAWDEADNTLWGWAQNGGAAGSMNQLVTAVELNPATMAATGRSFVGQIYPPNYPTASQNIAGGADIVCNLPFNANKLTLVGLHQTQIDTLLFYDLGVNCGGPSCYPDCNGDHALNVNDFICFQAAFAAGNVALADCNHDQALNVNDFICFQSAFAAGCSAP